MCVAILAVKGNMLSKEDAQDCYESNPDGPGFAFVNEAGVLQTRKGYLSFNDFWTAYFKAFTDHGQDSPFLIHFRIATKGVVGYKNCHPYDIEPGKSCVAHNGVLWHGTRQDAESDTQELVNDCRDQLKDEAFVLANKDRIGHIITKGNKLVFLYDTRNFVIVNEKSGDWNKDDTIWFSNYWWTGGAGYYGRRRSGPVSVWDGVGNSRSESMLDGAGMYAGYD